MKAVDVRRAADEAVAASPSRPATAILHDGPDARLIVFRLAPGQAVPPHRSVSTVTLTVISGRGYASGEDDERALTPGETVVFEPNELHGMRAESENFVLLATIAPCPGTRSGSAPEAVAAQRGQG